MEGPKQILHVVNSFYQRHMLTDPIKPVFNNQNCFLILPDYIWSYIFISILKGIFFSRPFFETNLHFTVLWKTFQSLKFEA